MIDRLTAIVAERASGRNVLAVLALASAVLLLFGQVLVPKFQAATGGLYPIDMSFPTTPTVIYRELAHYTADSRRIYTWFFGVDLVWPPLLATLFALSWCWLAARSSRRLPARLLAAGVLALPYAEALLDIAENFGYLTLMYTYPRRLELLAWITGTVKHTKLVLYALCWIATLTFAVLAVWPLRRSGTSPPGLPSAGRASAPGPAETDRGAGPDGTRLG